MSTRGGVMPRVPKPNQKYTYADYLTWHDDERWELIEGVPYNMAPAPSTKHQSTSFELSRQIGNALEGRECSAFSAPFDVRLPKAVNIADDGIDNVVQPDISVICDSSKLDDRGCLGAPDFIIEIISPSTASKDHIEKVRLYEKHGVKEYWIVHPIDKVVHIRKLGLDGKYKPAEIYACKEKTGTEVLPDLIIDWDLVFSE